MKYPRPEGPNNQRMRKIREERANRKLPPFKIVKMMLHGQSVDVKVYQPWWAQGDKLDKKRLGLDKESKW